VFPRIHTTLNYCSFVLQPHVLQHIESFKDAPSRPNLLGVLLRTDTGHSFPKTLSYDDESTLIVLRIVLLSHLSE